MASILCTNAGQLQQLVNILNANEPDYNWQVAGVDPYLTGYIRLFQFYANAEINGAVNYFAYLDYYGRQPFVVGMMTTLAALEDKAIADAVQYEYTVQAMNTLQVLLNLRMGALYNAAIGYSQFLYNAAIGHANALYNAAIGYVNGTAFNLQNNINAVYNVAIGHANQLYNAAVGYAQSLYNAAIGHANQLYNSGIAYTNANVDALNGSIAHTEARVDQLIGTDIAQVVRSITDVANTAEMEVQNAIKQAESVAATLAAGAGAAAVAQAIATLQPQISKIATDTATCLDPLCDTVTPNARQLGKLGNLLHDLTDASLLGLLLAVLVEAAHDPGQLVTDAENDLAGIVGTIETGLRDLIGV